MAGSFCIGDAGRAACHGDTASIEFSDDGLAAAVQGREGDDMGALTGGNVRVSLPFGCTDETVDHFIREIPDVINSVRADAGI